MKSCSIQSLLFSFFLVTSSISEVVYSPTDNLFFIDMNRSVSKVSLTDQNFTILEMEPNLFLELVFQKKGILIAKKSGQNLNNSIAENGDLVRFLDEGESIKLGSQSLEEVPNHETPLEIMNNAEHEPQFDRSISMSVFTLGDVDILQLRKSFFNNKTVYDLAIANIYKDQANVIVDEDDFIMDNYDTKPTTPIKEHVENYFRYYFMFLLRAEHEALGDQQGRFVEILNSAVAEITAGLDMKKYKPRFNKKKFMEKFNTMLREGFDMNLLISASLPLLSSDYPHLLYLPKEVKGKHTQQMETNRFSFSKKIIFQDLLKYFYLFTGLKSNNSKYMPLLQQVFEKVYSEITQIPNFAFDQEKKDVLENAMYEYITFEKIEISGWMSDFWHPIYQYAKNYMKTSQDLPNFNKMYVSDHEISKSKLNTILGFFDVDQYGTDTELYEIFVEQRRNLVLI